MNDFTFQNTTKVYFGKTSYNTSMKKYCTMVTRYCLCMVEVPSNVQVSMTVSWMS